MAHLLHRRCISVDNPDAQFHDGGVDVADIQTDLSELNAAQLDSTILLIFSLESRAVLRADGRSKILLIRLRDASPECL